MNVKKLAILLSLAACASSHALAETNDTYVPSNLKPPALLREFRAAWVATVGNIDWPSQPGLPVAQQKQELLAILDRAARLKLNAIIFQVRPACDALYASPIEPWAPYLAGVMGKAPEPFYDPLAFAVDAAHKRGLELHAWFNPFRASHPKSKSPISGNHISRTHPSLVRHYGQYLWLDPGEPEVRDYSLGVIMDVVARYDIDGVHFDDYFYPYPEKDARGRIIDFPDETSWRRFGVGGKLGREDWRRENINAFVQRVYSSIKTAKPWVKFGISPFGIWQPGNPAQIRGFNAYQGLYADSRKWLENGWLDYISPQLYWAVEPPETSYPALLNWWEKQNVKNRHVWPGNDLVKLGDQWKPWEIVNQIRLTRKESGGPGNIFWSIKCLMENRGGFATVLERDLYAEPALVPASPWLEQKPPGKPVVQAGAGNDIVWEPAEAEKASFWVLQTKTNSEWHTVILTGGT
ncbi:MAG TPA: family 10 glycosylhydrolase, partial [Verrucomicrobiae bacterium]|nr:family 10 glycosylhydrolase [Verrucomicrobiae bacterium]